MSDEPPLALHGGSKRVNEAFLPLGWSQAKLDT